MHIAICGGTGAIGTSLVKALAAAGHTVTIGSRSLEKAEAAAAEVGHPAVDGTENPDACRQGEVVLLAVPWDGAAALARQCAADLDGKVVISMINAMAMVDGRLIPLGVPQGSMAEAVQRAAPGARVVAALHHVPARELGSGEESDVLVCADDSGAKREAIDLINQMDGLCGIDAGDLVFAGAVESFTAVLTSINRIHKGRARIKLLGIRDRD